nr:hypothetical protein HK105_005741 [Polyrhizophydium stewartii]
MIMFYIVHDYKPSSIVQLIVVVLEDNGFYTYYWGRAMRTIYDMPPQVYVAMQPVEEAVEFDLKIWLTVAEILIIPFFFTFVFVSISVLNRSKIKLSVDILRTLLSFVPTALFQPLCMMILNSIMCSATNWCGVQVVSFYAIYGSVLLVLLVGIASISMSKFFDANPTHRNLHGFAHGRVSSIYYKVKFVAAAAYTFSHTALWIKALTAFLAPTIMLVVTLHFMPNYNLLYNRLRAGFYGGHAFSGLLSLVSWYIYTINGNQQLPIYVFYSMHLTWITGFVAMFWFAEHQYYSTQAKCHKALVRKLEAEANPVPDDQQTSEDHEANKYVFESWEQVEITARMFISYMTERRQHVEFQDLEEIHKIFKRGLVEFPEHPQLLMSYATYIYYLESHTQEATRYLRKLALLNPPAAIKFQLFCFKQSSAQVQEVDELGDGVRLDVTTYAEFRKIDFMARQQHSICESALHELWSVMMRKHVNMEQQLADIEAISIKLYAASNKADRYYSQLVGRFPKSVNYLRLYSKFAYEVMGDTNKGNALTTRAKLLERDRGSHERLYTPMTQPKKLSFSHPAAQPSRQGGAPLQSVVVDSGRDKGGKSGEGGDNDNEDDGDEAEFTVMSIDEGMNVQAQSNSNLEPRIGTRKRSLGDGLDAKSGTSRSSSEQAMSTMRDSLRSKLRGELNVLRISAILITLILIAIYCVMYGEFYYHVQKIASGLDARI